MRRIFIAALASIILCVPTAQSQTTVTTSSPTSANQVPVFSSGTSITNSPITVLSNGDVGIGTATPGDTLDVNGGIRSSYSSAVGPSVELTNPSKTANGAANHWDIYNMTGGYGNSLQFWDYDTIGCATGGMCGSRLTILDSGNVGIGTTTPFTQLDVNGSATTAGPYNNTPLPTLNQSASFSALFTDSAHSSGLMIGTLPYNAVWLQAVQPDLPNDAIHLFKWISLQPSGGAVGIGTTSPSYTLDVAGPIHSSSAVVYPDSTQQTTAWTGVLCGGDYSEAMNATGGKAKYEPGDVLVLASGGKGAIGKSHEPYSTMVAGIYATKPGVIGRRASLAKDMDEVPMAMIGVVPTKVSAENGSIHLGDLLVTASTPGFAMKGTDRSRMLGAVIGKAMSDLDAGTGVMEVLVTLQ